MRRLSRATLAELAPDIRRPLGVAEATGIVHLGVGAFHRAHQAAFTQDALDAGETAWGIAAASLRSPATRDALAPQDGLYALALRGEGGGSKCG
jgi:fructuronate reductase